jgi:hypothetical protein
MGELTAEERDALWAAVDEFVDRHDGLQWHGHGYLDRSRSDRIVAPAVERIIAARRDSLAERVKALADEWERHHATCDDCTGDYLSAARELRGLLKEESPDG